MIQKVTVKDVVENLKMQVLFGEDYLSNEVTKSMTSRPGVEIYSDYFEFYEANRIQVIGTKELNLFFMINDEQKKIRVDKLFAALPPAFIFTGNVKEIPDVFFDSAKKYNIPILKTKLRTTALIGKIGTYLSEQLAEKKTIHGVMLDIHGVGVLIKGKSFVGKSEAALELIKRGHTLISDDSVELIRKEDGEILASSLPLTERLMEIRGLGIVDVVDLFGVKAYRNKKRVMLVVELVRYQEGMKIDRLGINQEKDTIFDIEIPKVTIYVMPGRNLASLVEVAAMNWKLKSFGRDAAKEFIEKLDSIVERKISNMSFAQDVKKEIANLKVEEPLLKAELYGFLKLKGEIVIKNKQLAYELKTNLLPIVRRISSIIKQLYKVNIEVLEKERLNLDKKNIYVLTIIDKCKEILEDLKIIDNEYNYIEDINEDLDIESIIRGFFLAKGSINDPQNARYHFEIACNTIHEGTFLIKQFNEFGVYSKMSQRRGTYVVYIKKAEQIGDALKVIGSTNCMFDFENERIKRDLNNVVNRIINCDMANSDKTQKAAMRQLEQIEYLEKHLGFEGLPVRLMEAVTLRTQNPDATLQELSDISEECIGRFISKSGLTHCFKDLELKYLATKAKNDDK